MKIVLSGTVESIKSRADGTISIGLSTQEMDSTAVGNVFGLRSKYVKCLLSDSNISPLEENMIEETAIADASKVKSRSQRLRGVLYRVYETLHTDQTFEQYYADVMDKLIAHYKQKLD